MKINQRKPRVLYAFQGTGNGHIVRASEIIPHLKQVADVDILISGKHVEVTLPYKIKYRMQGYGFFFGRNGGIDFSRTFINGNVLRLLTEINQLPVKSYDFVINDFEPVSAWACHFKGVPCIGLSHQSAVVNPASPKPDDENPLGNLIINHYAPTDYDFGFHFRAYAHDIFTPVIRADIRNTTPRDNGHYTVYLPAWDDEKIIHLIKLFGLNRYKWEIFSKQAKQIRCDENITIFPVQAQQFGQSMANCTGILCGAGFETPAEALYLGKKLYVVPMSNQYEQQCNAAALNDLTVPFSKKLDKDHFQSVFDWVTSGSKVNINYPDHTEFVVAAAVEKGMELREDKKSVRQPL